MKLRNIFAWVLLALAVNVAAQPVRDEHVEALLVPETTAVVPGQSFWVALKLVHDEHWHTYWINDGDSGLPTKIKWDMPEGFSAGPIIWPHPQRIPMPPLVSFGYEGETWLLTEITAPASLTASEVMLRAKVSWLMCKEVCIPGKATLELTLPVAQSAAVAHDFSGARAKIPARETGWTFAAKASDDAVVIFAKPPPGAAALESLDLFAMEKGVVASAGEVAWTREGDAYRIQLVRDAAAEKLPESFRAVLVAKPTMASDPARPAVELDILFGGSPGAATVAPASAPPSLALISLFAFLGGIILNLMPCVFPVISLKILGFVKQAGEDPRSVWHHGLVFAAGVVVSFWLLAGALLALRAGGAGIGWGFQLQSPEVLVVLSLLFFTLALNLFGVFEVGLSLTGAGGGMARQSGFAGSFFSGFLATVIATPCTAPFMGVALGYALTQPPQVAMIVFTALAVGMAFPYLLLSRFPALLKKLPRPGAWMETMKQVMGFFLLATVVWLFWVLSALVASITLTGLMGGFLFAAIGAWVLGTWDTLARATPVRWRGRVVGVGMMVLAVVTGLQTITAAGPADRDEHAEWKAFSPAAVAEARAAGQPVFIDFTAKWCLTCQVNKLTVLRTDEVMNEFRDRGVSLFYADWTDENEMIAAELANYGRQSVPLYLWYGAGAAAPVILPEILTKKIVRDALQSSHEPLDLDK